MDELQFRLFRPSDAGAKADVFKDIGSVKGMTGHVNGEIKGHGGVFTVGSYNFAWFELCDEGFRKPILLHRLATGFLGALERSGLTSIMTTCDRTKPHAERWMRRLGFHPLRDEDKDEVLRMVEEINEQEVWIWQASQR